MLIALSYFLSVTIDEEVFLVAQQLLNLAEALQFYRRGGRVWLLWRQDLASGGATTVWVGALLHLSHERGATRGHIGLHAGSS